MTKLLIIFLCAGTMGNVFASVMYIKPLASSAIYDTPDSTAQVITILDKNEPVTVIKTNIENGFSYIKTDNNISGWIPTPFLEKTFHEEKKLTLWERLKAQIINTTHSVEQIKNTEVDKVNFAQSSDGLSKQVNELQAQVTALKNKQHSAWFWFILGVAVTWFCFIIRGLFGKKKKRNRRSSNSVYL